MAPSSLIFKENLISAEIRYKTHNGELLIILKAFKIWKHYLKECNHEVLIFTNHNNLYWFIDTKIFSIRQVKWAQKLSRYHFYIDYQQSKANGAVDTLSYFSQKSQAKENEIKMENTRILHKLHSLLTNASFLCFSNSAELSPLYQVFICETYVLSQLQQFWVISKTN